MIHPYNNNYFGLGTFSQSVAGYLLISNAMLFVEKVASQKAMQTALPRLRNWLIHLFNRQEISDKRENFLFLSNNKW